MKITKSHRQKLEYYLKEFYKHYPQEKYTIFHFVKYFKQRLNNNKDAWAGVCGETGTGKTYFGIITGILFGRPYDITKNVTYMPEGDEILENFKRLKKNVFQVDEAAKELRAVNWQNKNQQGVNTAAMTERYLNNLVLLMMPNFQEFTKSLRTGSIIFRIVVVYRTKTHARVIVQRKSRNWRSEDPWGDKAANKNYETLDRKKKEITNEAILNIERMLPNTLMDFIIPNLELILPEITDKYKELKLASRETKTNNKTENKLEKRYKNQYEDTISKAIKALYHNELNIGKLKVTKTEIASLFNISVDTFNKYLHKREPNDKPKLPTTVWLNNKTDTPYT